MSGHPFADRHAKEQREADSLRAWAAPPAQTPPTNFTVGQRVRMVRVADDLRCRHVGGLGTIEQRLEDGAVRREARWWIIFDAGGAHACYASELEAAP